MKFTRDIPARLVFFTFDGGNGDVTKDDQYQDDWLQITVVGGINATSAEKWTRKIIRLSADEQQELYELLKAKHEGEQ